MLKHVLVGLLSLATFTQAAPRRHDLKSGYESALEARESLPLNVHQSRKKPSVPLNVFAANEIWFSSNWGGVVKTTTNITSVSGTFTVPTLQLPAGGNASTTYGASAWVGIDGWSCTGSRWFPISSVLIILANVSAEILQTGIDMNLKNGTALYSGWYEWLPGFADTFTGFQISAGDTITATVKTTSSTSGTAKLENLSTGQTVKHTFNGGVAALCNVNAEWIVEVCRAEC